MDCATHPFNSLLGPGTLSWGRLGRSIRVAFEFAQVVHKSFLSSLIALFKLVSGAAAFKIKMATTRNVSARLKYFTAAMHPLGLSKLRRDVLYNEKKSNQPRSQTSGNEKKHSGFFRYVITVLNVT